jgi:multiple sugar transport system ATP-binding protein
MASLSVEAVSKRFGKTEALQEVDLRVADGEFCVLLGPSGCGKSTLLAVIAGLVPADRGSVLFDDRPVDHLTPRERDVAMVFQSYALYPHMTVAENMGFGLRMRGVPKAQIRRSVRDAAALLGIENLLDRKPRQLSGGQRQRVAMGRAIVRRPNLFLLDEPLSNLDARLRASVRLELKRIHRQVQGTIVYVTHDQVEAMTLGDRVVVMGEGRVHQVDPPERLYRRPQSTFVARFVGSPEMNIFSGRILRRNGGSRFRGRGFELDLRGADIPEGQAELGVRPEDLYTDGPDAHLPVRLELVSHLGSGKIVTGRIGQERITFSAPKDSRLAAGENVHLGVERDKIHLFRNGRRLPDRPP